MPRSVPSDELPLRTSYFRVLIGDRELGFSDISALSSVTSIAELPEETVHRYETVILRRAVTRSSELYDWRRRFTEKGEDRREVTIHQLDRPDGRIVNSWRLVGAWPCRWSGPVFNALNPQIAYEEIELAFHDLVWLKRRPKPSKHTTNSGG